MPLDDQYAADELSGLLSDGADVLKLKVGNTPTIDLSSDELCQQDWTGIRFDWLATAYLKDIDLRGADLKNSFWGHANLTGADLQCTHLYKADLSYANLTGADLRGADLYKADLSHANLTGADLRGADLLEAQLPAGVTSAQQEGSTRVLPGPWNPGQ
jgi:uncharacterized protein YjbI with pentapeptide repeats